DSVDLSAVVACGESRLAVRDGVVLTPRLTRLTAVHEPLGSVAVLGSGPFPDAIRSQLSDVVRTPADAAVIVHTDPETADLTGSAPLVLCWPASRPDLGAFCDAAARHRRSQS